MDLRPSLTPDNIKTKTITDRQRRYWTIFEFSTSGTTDRHQNRDGFALSNKTVENNLESLLNELTCAFIIMSLKRKRIEIGGRMARATPPNSMVGEMLDLNLTGYIRSTGIISLPAPHETGPTILVVR